MMLCSVRSPPLKTLNPTAMMTSRLFSIRLLHPALPLYRVLAAASVSRRAFSVRSSAGQPKSLVDEEAELSDWVTGIRMESSFRPGKENGGRRQRDRRHSDSDEDFGSPFDRRNMEGRGQKRSFLGSDSDDSEEESYGGGRGKRGGRGGGSLGPRDGGRRGGKFGTERRTVRDGWKGTGTFSRSREGVGNVHPRFASGRKGGRRFEMGRKRAGFESTGDDEDEDDDFGFAGEVGGGRGRRFDMTQRKGFDKKGVSFASTEEDEDEVAGGRGRRFDTRQRTGLHKEGFSFESTEEDAEDGLVGEGEKEFEGSSSYKAALAGRSLEKKEGGLDGKHDSYLSNSRFDECSLSPLSLKGVKAAGYERMTVVQEETLPIILRGGM